MTEIFQACTLPVFTEICAMGTSDRIGDARRSELVQAALREIIAHGLEGLRTRAIAEQAGVNVSTLHYYFPSKEALIAGVVEFVMSELVAVHAPATSSATGAVRELRQEFTDIAYYRRSRPDLVIAIQEFSLRAGRDPNIARIVDLIYSRWRETIARTIASGQREGVFRTDFRSEELAATTMASILGSLNSAVPIDAIDTVSRQIERWLRTGAPEAGA